MSDDAPRSSAISPCDFDRQEREVSDLRARTNTVIAAATLTASFLGAAAIREHGVVVWAVLALAVLLITGGLSLFVRWPRQACEALRRMSSSTRLLDSAHTRSRVSSTRAPGAPGSPRM